MEGFFGQWKKTGLDSVFELEYPEGVQHFAQGGVDPKTGLLCFLENQSATLWVCDEKGWKKVGLPFEAEARPSTTGVLVSSGLAIATDGEQIAVVDTVGLTVIKAATMAVEAWALDQAAQHLYIVDAAKVQRFTVPNLEPEGSPISLAVGLPSVLSVHNGQLFAYKDGEAAVHMVTSEGAQDALPVSLRVKSLHTDGDRAVLVSSHPLAVSEICSASKSLKAAFTESDLVFAGDKGSPDPFMRQFLGVSRGHAYWIVETNFMSPWAVRRAALPSQ
eukprot:NODE_2568_length_1166_cov_53.596240_g2347_i0.p1 GENE.NODE_2568_length_1166_cov_53.596240_g2347_i0~~NODE_2568_length_1166_cov_53.596240_g2347_i0.p1  ORF type:complete len:291 (+),score=67.01 NODE_2568_length_1166_cov_53.596240_g2347_i0:51-875(+)